MSNTQQAEAPRYKILETSYVHDRLHDADEEITFHGEPGFHMEPLNDAAKEAHDAYRARLVREGKLTPNDPGYTSSLIAKNLKEGTPMGAGLHPVGPATQHSADLAKAIGDGIALAMAEMRSRDRAEQVEHERQLAEIRSNAGQTSAPNEAIQAETGKVDTNKAGDKPKA